MEEKQKNQNTKNRTRQLGQDGGLGEESSKKQKTRSAKDQRLSVSICRCSQKKKRRETLGMVGFKVWLVGRRGKWACIVLRGWVTFWGWFWLGTLGVAWFGISQTKQQQQHKKPKQASKQEKKRKLMNANWDNTHKQNRKTNRKTNTCKRTCGAKNKRRSCTLWTGKGVVAVLWAHWRVSTVAFSLPSTRHCDDGNGGCKKRG